MTIRKKILAAIAIAALIPLCTTAQTYDANQNVKNVSPAIPEPNALLSTACSTPLTPTSCASTSYQIYQIGAQGVGSYSFQFNAINSGVFQFEASNDCLNFITTSLAQSGTTPLTTTSTATATGFYTGIGAARACIAIVVTTAPSTLTTVVPFMSQKIGDVGIHNSVPVTIANPTAFPTFPASIGVTGFPTFQPTAAPGPTDGNSVPYVHPTSAGSVQQPYGATNNQTPTPNSMVLGGCLYTAAPTLTAGNVQPELCDAAGNRYVNIGVALPAGTNFLGQVAIGASGNALSQGTISTTAKGGSNIGLFTNSICDAYNGTSFDPCKKDVETGGPFQVDGGGGATNVACTGGTSCSVASGNHRLASILITTVGTTGTITCYDGTSASGTVIGGVSASNGTLLFFNAMFDRIAATGIYCVSATSGPAYTVSYY